jgi:prepilin-type N-terminal cleavage/methylation domain-containing protein
MLSPGVHRQQGFSLIEMMIAIALASIVMLGLIFIAVASIRGSNDSAKMARLHQDLRAVMTLVERDLKRAGAWDASMDVPRIAAGTALTLVGSVNSGSSVTLRAKKTTATPLPLELVGSKAVGTVFVYVDSNGNAYRATVTAFGTDGSNQWFTATLNADFPSKATEVDGIDPGSWTLLDPLAGVTVSVNADGDTEYTFAYDRNKNGTLESNENVGFRRTAANSSLELRTSPGTWEAMTDPGSVEITAFTITNHSPAALTSNGMNINLYEYSIEVTGRLNSDTSVQRTLRETVRVRNDRLS